jgi:hypothetical protein
MMREIMDVPLPLAASRRLINFLTFQISMFFSASFGCGALILIEGGPYEGGQSLGSCLQNGWMRVSAWNGKTGRSVFAVGGCVSR